MDAIAGDSGKSTSSRVRRQTQRRAPLASHAPSSASVGAPSSKRPAPSTVSRNKSIPVIATIRKRKAEPVDKNLKYAPGQKCICDSCKASSTGLAADKQWAEYGVTTTEETMPQNNKCEECNVLYMSCFDRDYTSFDEWASEKNHNKKLQVEFAEALDSKRRKKPLFERRRISVNNRSGFRIYKKALFGSKADCRKFIKAKRIGKLKIPCLKVKAASHTGEEDLYGFQVPNDTSLRKGHMFHEVTLNNEQIYLAEADHFFEDQHSQAETVAKAEMLKITNFGDFMKAKLRTPKEALQRFASTQDESSDDGFSNAPGAHAGDGSDVETEGEASDHDSIAGVQFGSDNAEDVKSSRSRRPSPRPQTPQEKRTKTSLAAPSPPPLEPMPILRKKSIAGSVAGSAALSDEEELVDDDEFDASVDLDGAIVTKPIVPVLPSQYHAERS